MTFDSAIVEMPDPAQRPMEIVERKGTGHPDTICDALAENLSAALRRFWLEMIGAVPHYNVDKVLLRGGAARRGDCADRDLFRRSGDNPVQRRRGAA